MPAGNASTDGSVPDLYVQAQTARRQAQFLAGELGAIRHKTSENWQLIQASWERAGQIAAQRTTARTSPERLRYSAYARLQARLVSMPVIEQAKGIIMAKYGWTDDQAFDALRRASQRENIKVRELAIRLVAQAARQAPAPRQARPAATATQAGAKATAR